MDKYLVLLFLALMRTSKAQLGYLPSASPSYSYNPPGLRSSVSSQEIEDPVTALAANIPGGGVPGQHYPILASVPQTGFSCQSREFPGYFADTTDEARCQVFHICQFDGRLDSFLCPNGTVFNQQYFVCDWWFNVDCAASEQFFALNSEIGKIPEDADASIRSDAGTLNQLYSVPEQRQASPSPPPTPSQFYNRPNRL
ncbi:uncharacterized protein [Procambarus clarkii]|uniref:uncharacterized protein n=1 Tax=Procambarus clarkii TaxID=6728 RepID=UPI003742FBFB